MSRGALIALEGLDRSGKTTQGALLASRDPTIKILKFPNRASPTGQLINTFLTTTVPMAPQTIHLLFSANRWEAVAAVLSLLAAGTTIVLDRYVYSGIAFSVGKGLEYDWCKAPDVGLPRPDRVVFLNVAEEVQSRRGGFGGERYETPELQKAVRGVFERMMHEEGSEDWRVIDAAGTEEEVAEAVWRVVEEAREEVRGGSGEVRVFR